MGRLGLCGTNGSKFEGIKAHMNRAIGETYEGEFPRVRAPWVRRPVVTRCVRAGLDMTLDTFPADGVVDYKAYDKALEAFKPGDAATIFTPGPSLALLQVSTGLARRTWRVHRHWLCMCSVVILTR